MKIALILLNYNDYETTIKYINIVKNYDIITNIVVVDNCSTNNSYQKLKEHESEKISVIKSQKNGGYAYGNNFGIKYAKDNFNPQYLIISNPDVFFKEELVKRMQSVVENEKNIGIVSAKVRNYNSKMPTAWKLPTYTQNLLSLSIILDKLLNNNTYKDSYFDGEISYVDVIPGSFFFVKTEVFFEIGLFDENTFLFGEENILAYKMKRKNYNNIILNKYQYIHEHSVSINKSYNSLIQKYKILYESLDYYNKAYLKTGKFKNIIFYLFWRITNFEKALWFKVKSIKKI